MPVIVPPEGAPPIVADTELALYQSGDAATLLAQATALVRSYCGWHITPSITEQVVVDCAGAALMLPSLHVTSVDSIVADGVAVDSADFGWSPAGVIRRTAYPWTWSGSATVTFTHGHVSVPDVASVIMALVTRMQASPGGGFVRQVGQVSYQTPTGDGGGAFLESEKATLNRYRIPKST